MQIKVLFDVASKLRQLIEQLFEIRMSEQCEFSVQEIVWASVQKYPPWPAKIVRKLNHHGKTVFKVNFFGEPTYCYLHSDSLRPFNILDKSELNEMEQNLKLRRALELAKFSLSSHYDPSLFKNSSSFLKPTQQPYSPTTDGEACADWKEIIDVPQKKQQLKNLKIVQSNPNEIQMQQISPSNVVEVLESYRSGKMVEGMGNLKRKQLISFQNKLKQNLLFKYNLQSIDFLKQTPKSSQNISTPLLQKRNPKKEKKNNHLQKFGQKELCLRKIQKLLFQKGMDRQTTYSTAIKIVNQIEKESHSIKEVNSSLFKENIIRTLQQIGSKMQQIQQMELQYFLKNILSLVEMDLQQHKFEEGSRMTQINEQFVL